MFPLLIAMTINAGAQCVMSCKSNLEVSLNTSGYRVLTPSMLLDASTTCDAPYFIDIDGPLADTAFCDQADDYLVVLVQHVTSGERCYAQIQVKDHLSPSITCPPDLTIHCTEDRHDLTITGEPFVFENCIPDISYLDNTDSLSSCLTGYVDRTWTAEDPSGNEDACVQRIYVVDTIPPVVSFPEDITIGCKDNPYDLMITGQPEVSDDCSNDIGIVNTDAVYPTCGGSRRIVRHWEVIDWCNYNPVTGEGVYEEEQVIALLDLTDPVISCPNDLTVGNDPGTCEASLFLPEATASDACSSVEIEAYEMIDGDLEWLNSDIQQSFPLGTHDIYYIATDACGNTDTCSSQIFVIDDEDPEAITPLSKTFSITTGGITRVHAIDLDNGSSDNCAIDTMLISRDSITFHGYLDFSCDDVADSPIEIWFKLIDESGNQVINSVVLVIKDKLYPNISCPADLSIFCEEDPLDTNLTGMATGSDNCSYTITFQDIDNRNSCGLGYIERTWTISDIDDNQTNCLQTIEVRDTTPPQIVIPPDTVLSCGSSTDPMITGYADVDDDCGDFGFSYTDDVFFINAPESYRLFRRWKVVNFCDTTYEEIYTQLIEVLDTVGPVIHCPADTVITTTDSTCTGYAILQATMQDNCSSDLDLNHNSIYADDSGASASGFYPKGIHTILFTASDGSNNISTCEVTVEVVDSFAPAVVCQLGLIINLPPAGYTDISPEFIDAGSFDNCTDTADLDKIVVPSRFSCETLGEVDVTLTVTDETGNKASCVSTIRVQDNAGHCPDLIDISGLLITEYGEEIKGAEMTLIGDGGDTVMTDDAGTYTFVDQPVGSNYVVRPSMTANPSNGISTYDFLLIRRHLLNDQVFDSPYKMIAADANKSNSISTFDILVLRRLLLNHIQELPNNTAWRFVDAEYVFPDPFDPFTDPFPEEVFLDGVMIDKPGVDFVGVKVGDVNGTANPQNMTGNATVRGDFQSLPLRVELLRENENMVAEVYMPEDFTWQGFQFSLHFQPEMGEITSVEYNDEFGFGEDNYVIDDNKPIIHVSWDGLPGVKFSELEPFLRIYLSTSGIHMLPSDILMKEMQGLTPEAYSSGDRIFSLDIIEAEKLTNLPAAFPNPFIEKTFLPVEPTRGQIGALTVYNSIGQVCYREKMEFSGEEDYWILEGNDLPEAGIYYYEIQTGTKRITGKVQRLK